MVQALLVSIALATVAAIAVAGIPLPYEACRSSNEQTWSVGDIQVDVNAWPPVPGQQANLTASFKLLKPVAAATAHVSVTLDDMVVQKLSVDACLLFACGCGSLKVGDAVQFSKSIELPAFMPKGHWGIDVKVEDSSNAELLCLTLKADTTKAVSLIYPFDASPHSVDFKSCGIDESLVSNVSIEISPWPVEGGKALTLSVHAQLAESIKAGTYALELSISGFTIFTKSGDLSAFRPLPWTQGPLVASKTETIPSFITSGEFGVQIKFFSEGAQKVCLSFEIVVGSPSNIEIPLLSDVSDAHPISYLDCGIDRSLIPGVSIDVTPWPVEGGNDVSIVVRAQLAGAITSGTYELALSFHGFTILKKIGDLGELQPLPWSAGSLVLKWDANPSIASGEFDVTLKLFTGDRSQKACMSFEVSVGSGNDIARVLHTLKKGVEDGERPVYDEDMIDAINTNPRSTWVAGRSTRFAQHLMKHVARLCGSLPGEGPSLPFKKAITFDESLSIPESFDAREEWGSMCASVHDVRDQGDCGSCWAFGAVEAMSDRLCIASSGAIQSRLSAEDLVSCCGLFKCGSGCNGGYPSGAWSYWESEGIVSGGDYNSSEGCYPYELPPCEHHTQGVYPPCAEPTAATPRCKKECKDGERWSAAKTFAGVSYRVTSDEQSIQKEIMTHGPVEGAFTVYADFPSYKSGVYKHMVGGVVGGHAIKIIGWGTDDASGTPYWIVANSWRDDWGDQGYFKIVRGQDECGIESSIVAGLPRLTPSAPRAYTV